jgi:hypothetical protein
MSKTRPGALFHLVRVLQHLERTYDLMGMDGGAVSHLLPDAFKNWLPEKELFDLNGIESSRVQETPTMSYERNTSASTLSPTDRNESWVSMDGLQIGEQYTREQLAEMWGYASYHALARGVVTPKDTHLINLFVTESSAAGESPHYVNVLGANSLAWEGPEDHFAEERIVSSDKGSDEIHVFYREVHRSAFRYLGRVQVRSFTRNTDRPSRFVFALPEGAVAND